MPSKPAIPGEPTLEELSAYLDHELEGDAQARVAEHITGCQHCQVRLDGLRQTVHAVRALPMETPPRSFTIPAQRRQSYRWAPVGWLGGAAAALLIVAVGVQQLQGPAGSTSLTSGGAAQKSAGSGVNELRSGDQYSAAQPASRANATTVSDPRQPSRSVTLSTDAASYAANGSMTVHVQLVGLKPEEVSQPRLLLERNGYAIELTTPTQGGSVVPASLQVSYALGGLPLSNPVAGKYTLMLIERLPGDSGATLVARLPITIGG